MLSTFVQADAGNATGIHYPVPAEQDIMGRYFTLGIRARL